MQDLATNKLVLTKLHNMHEIRVRNACFVQFAVRSSVATSSVSSCWYGGADTAMIFRGSSPVLVILCSTPGLMQTVSPL